MRFSVLMLVLDVMSTSCPVLRQLHWLPVRERIEWIILMCQFQSTRRWMACLRSTWRMTASLPLYYRPTTTSIVQRRYTDSNKSGWSLFHCCGPRHSVDWNSVEAIHYVILIMNLGSWGCAGCWRCSCFADDCAT